MIRRSHLVILDIARTDWIQLSLKKWIFRQLLHKIVLLTSAPRIRIAIASLHYLTKMTSLSPLVRIRRNIMSAKFITVVFGVFIDGKKGICSHNSTNTTRAVANNYFTYKIEDGDQKYEAHIICFKAYSHSSTNKQSCKSRCCNTYCAIPSLSQWWPT